MVTGTAARRIFAYGTLAATEVMEALLGRLPPAAPAVLEGYQRHPVRGHAYPGIVEQPGASTGGLVYEGLDPADLALLDHFEGDLYERRTVRVRTGEGLHLAAEAYVVPPRLRHLLQPEPWDLDRFRSTHLRDYVRHCAGLARPAARAPAPSEDEP